MPGVYSLVTLPSPIPKPGLRQALVRIHAVALNYRDVLVADHNPKYPVLADTNIVPCSDASGVVEAAGAESQWQKGDRVFLHPNTGAMATENRPAEFTAYAGAGSVDGTLRRFLVWNDDRLIKAPEGLSFEEAAAIYAAGVTAYSAFFHGPRMLEPGMTVLTQGTGGVSCFGIQIATAAGATVIATSSSDSKLAVARKLGAQHLVNYRTTPDWPAEVLKATGGVGVDVVLDVVGASSMEQTVKATRHGGAVVVTGMLSEDPSQKVDIINALLFGAKTLSGLLVGQEGEAEETAAFLEKHGVHPHIAEVFEFEEADKALEAMRDLTDPGKVVVRVN